VVAGTDHELPAAFDRVQVDTLLEPLGWIDRCHTASIASEYLVCHGGVEINAGISRMCLLHGKQ
jgi:hypothetical protein